ncbi:MAG: TldD/PmbA family protein [Acidimicrobiia bacterium]|nr:TldD/PmbA family protein [Acidimicrobiia bacterium]
MSRSVEETRDAVLDRLDGRCEAEVLVMRGPHELTRFANSFIHQNVGEQFAQVHLKVAIDGRVAAVQTTSTSETSLASLVEDAVAIAAITPPDAGWPGFSEPEDPVGSSSFDTNVENASPGERADVVAQFLEAGPELSGAGYCETLAQRVAYGNTNGQTLSDHWSRAVIDGIHQTPGSAGSGHVASHALADLDALGAGEIAAAKARAGIGAVDVKPGEYEVVLEPNAVGTVAMFLAAYGYNGKMVADGQSFYERDAAQLDDSLSLWDDPGDSRAIGVPFDIEGTPKSRLDLIELGVSRAVSHNRSSAARASTRSNGRAIPAPMGTWFGPVATNLFVAPGTESLDDLIAGVDRGLLVTEFNYCRVLDPRTLVVTGLSRNGTFMIENGEITHPVTNLRFTQSFLTALGPGRLLGIESTTRFSNSEYGAGFTHVPSLRLAGWNFSGNADG